VRSVIQFLIDHAEVIAISRVSGDSLDRVFEKRNSDGECAGVKVGPGQGIGGIRGVGHSAAGDLCQAQSHVEVTAVFEEQIGKIVGREGVVGLHRESLLVGGLGLLPIAFAFVKRAKRDDDLDVGRGQRYGALVTGDRGIAFAQPGLYARKSDDGAGISGRKFGRTGERLLRSGLLGIAQLRLTQKKSQRGVVGRFLQLVLDALDRKRRLATLEVKVGAGFLRLERVGIAL